MGTGSFSPLIDITSGGRRWIASVGLPNLFSVFTFIIYHSPSISFQTTIATKVRSPSRRGSPSWKVEHLDILSEEIWSPGQICSVDWCCWASRQCSKDLDRACLKKNDGLQSSCLSSSHSSLEPSRNEHSKVLRDGHRYCARWLMSQANFEDICAVEYWNYGQPASSRCCHSCSCRALTMFRTKLLQAFSKQEAYLAHHISWNVLLWIRRGNG